MAQETQRAYPETKIIRRLGLFSGDKGAAIKDKDQMTFGLKNANMEILVWAKGENEKGKGPIRANLGMTQVMLLCNVIDRISHSENKEYIDIEVRHSKATDPEDRSKREVRLQATIRVAKDSEGYVYIGVFDQDETRKRVLFRFEMDMWTGALSRNGQTMDGSEISCMCAQSHAEALREIIIANAEISTQAEFKNQYGLEDNKQNRPSSTKPANNNFGGFEDISY